MKGQDTMNRTMTVHRKNTKPTPTNITQQDKAFALIRQWIAEELERQEPLARADPMYTAGANQMAAHLTSRIRQHQNRQHA